MSVYITISGSSTDVSNYGMRIGSLWGCGTQEVAVVEERLSPMSWLVSSAAAPRAHGSPAPD